MIPWLDTQTPFPPVALALSDPNGLLAAGANLSPERLIEAYKQGIFPWFNEGDPILWWSPDPRMVLFPDELKISRSLRKTLKKQPYEIRVDTAFKEVMQGCAAPRNAQAGTWISPRMIAAYTRLHELGIAHSVEAWSDDQLVGGLYGMAIGKMFYGESMFSRFTDASKIPFAHLVKQLKRWGFGMIDCQMNTPHLASLGAREISRDEFSHKLSNLIAQPEIIGFWQFDHDLFE
ncbi:leucyl/phenylalanyl-tRNA--protein transferase [Sulfurirhabdus autotrophica]|uniref:Leucyl/phenylalanyl-tRNA--protein transferase n=1 Tax=Sulfurirhabdus autotrophica TaxID=1706046 RepID=A0A4R3Y9V1_9PROT|nr:leucyl/phenylalanyl-tRNA--protein transferase [Sulfurirhabdus autotrophica]TCV87434.1 leucyl/phenylalanyl-tRNA--protein transferase [Sulfurirhabdus autotrophica]